MPQSSRICSFAILVPVYHLFDYKVDETLAAEPGTRFLLPFGRGQKVGLLVSCDSRSSKSDEGIKSILQPLDNKPLLSRHLLELASWLADYYCQPLGEVLFQCMPRIARKAESMTESRVQVWKANDADEAVLQSLEKKAPRQHKLYKAMQSSDSRLNAADLRSLHSAWHQPVKALQNRGLATAMWQENLPAPEISNHAQLQLTTDQQQIFDAINPLLDQFLVQLIQGVTGSGKTEVYLALMQQVIARGRQVIYLAPEIGLTPQLLRRLQRGLGHGVVVSHSAQTDYQRYQSWDQFRRGVVQVMVGTRSALFADSLSLGLIIIDEEHDSSYRQQDGVRYHARDVAIKRAQMLDIPVLLGSATPSLESLHNVQKNHYRLYHLDQRVNKSRPPPVELVDCSQQVLKSGCSPRLVKEIGKHLSAQSQVLLFLNRRGYAPVVMCHECGWQASCYQCDARLTLHQSMNRLICHHCGFAIPAPVKCPQCRAGKIRHYGIGTEQLEEYLSMQFPAVDIIRIDRDSVSSSHHMEQKMKPLSAGNPCILLGTQMLAKGHDYPHITLVGILDADQALFSSFYRAGERLIQTVLQVSGRAGRAEKKGVALLQTRFPGHPLMKGLCRLTYSELITPILKERKMLGFPPYVRVVTFQVDALEQELAMQKLAQVKGYLAESDVHSRVKIIGPIPALMARRVGRYRAQLSVLAADIRLIRLLLKQVMPQIRSIRNTQKSRLTIEVDPLDL